MLNYRVFHKNTLYFLKTTSESQEEIMTGAGLGSFASRMMFLFSYAEIGKQAD
jgi:hypothetical protein